MERTAAIPFFIAAGVVFINCVVLQWIQAAADRRQQALLDRVWTDREKALSDLAAVREDHFESIIAWIADAGSAFASLAGLVASAYLLLSDIDNVEPAVVYAGLAVALLSLLALIWLLVQPPDAYKRKLVSGFQAILIGSNLLMAIVILICGGEAPADAG